MAYLTPSNPICPSCGYTAALTWITGVPLDNRPRAGRGYVKVHKGTDWVVEKKDGKTIIYCPTCSTEIAQRSLKPKGKD